MKNNWGKAIKTLRIASGKRQAEVAKDFEVSRQTVSNWENNNIIFTTKFLDEICRYYHKTFKELLSMAAEDSERKGVEYGPQ